MLTPAQYATKCFKEGKFCDMTIEPSLMGGFYLHDADFKALKSKYYLSREAAAKDRSKIRDRAAKRYWNGAR